MDETKPHLIYFADAMCSWCWGFAPVTEAIERDHGVSLPIRLIVGGLRPGTVEPMNDKTKATVRSHWQHVHDASGQPFDFDFFARDGFVYDSHPAAKAVVAVRSLDPGATLPFFRAVQRAFYASNANVTQIDTLTGLAVQHGCDEAAFRQAFASEAIDRETWTDYAIAQKTGVTGFPTLIAGTGTDNRYVLIAQGYRSPADALALIEAWRTEAGIKS